MDHPSATSLTALFSPDSLLWRMPDRLTDITSWHSHIPLAFFLVQSLQPRRIVELGTHKGDSYCAFCQAVDQLALDTECFAIDSWEGDRHAGSYGDAIYQELTQYHQPRYGRFSQLIRSRFDDALDHFESASIDLLHIDGLHTYEAVKHDFESWLPKMRPGGLVLLHDTGVRTEDFGVWRLWNEISPGFPSFHIGHGHGLGVVVVNGATPPILEPLFTDTDAVRALIRLFFVLGDRVAAEGRARLYQTIANQFHARMDAAEQQLAAYQARTQ